MNSIRWLSASIRFSDIKVDEKLIFEMFASGMYELCEFYYIVI